MRAFPNIAKEEEERIKAESRLLSKTDLHYLAKHILGYNRITDGYHRRMAQDIDTPNYKFRLLLHSRGHFKSTLGTEAYSVKRLLMNPNERILITNVKLSNSRKFLRAISNHFEGNSRFRWLWREWWINEYASMFHKADMGDKLDWVTKNTQDEFTLLRPYEGREASITTGALDASMVSQHYSAIVADDLVNREFVRTSEGVERSILYFKDLLDLLDPSGDLCLIGCLTADTKILMGDGSWKEIVDVRAGDTVFSYKDKKAVKRKVLAQIPQGEDNVFEIKTARHIVRANARHPFLVVRNGIDIEPYVPHTCGNPEYGRLAPYGECPRCDILHDAWKEKWVRADELKIGDKVLTCARAPVDTCKRHYGGRRLTSDFFWLLGYLFGDGWLINAGERGITGVACALSACSKENKKVQSLFEKWLGVPYETSYGYIRLDSEKVGRWLESIGFFGTSHTKRVPQWIKSTRTCYKKAFIDGLIQADGSKMRGEGYRIELVNRELIEDLYWLSLTCGYRPTTIFTRTRTMQPPNSPDLVTSTFYSIGLTYNTRQAWGWNQYTWRWERVKSITPAGREEVYDLTIEDTENFIANGYITHNTRWAHMDLYNWIIEEFGGVASLRVPKGYVREEIVEQSKKCAEEDKRWMISIQPCFDEKGEPVFPEEFSKETLDELARIKGPYEFGCFPAGSKVLTSSGMIPIEAIQVGDKVISKSGTLETVEYVNAREHKGELVKITPRVLSTPIYATPNHPFWVQRSAKYRCWLLQPDTKIQTGQGNPRDTTDYLPKFDWVRADEINSLDVLYCPISQETVQPEGIWTNLDAWYLLGRWLAEGDLQKTGCTICAGLHEKDLIKKDAEIIRTVFDRKGRVYMGSKKETYRVTFSHPEFMKIVRESYLGKPGQKVLPSWMEYVPIQYLQKLWNGYFSGDGFVCQKGYTQANSVSLLMLQQFQRILWKLGNLPAVNQLYGATTKSIIKGRRVSQQALWNLRFVPNRIRQNLGPTWFVDEGVGVRVSKVERVPFEGTVYNLQVSGDHTFVVEHVAVHNSQYLLNPTAKENQSFNEEWFRYLDVMPDPQDLSVCITVDPAKSLLDRADMTAFLAFGYDKSNHMYLLDGLNERLTVDELPEALFNFVLKWYRKAKYLYPVGFEAVGFQETFVYTLERMMLERNFFFNIEPITRRVQKKEDRILRLVPRVKNGFYVPRRLMIKPYTTRDAPYDLTQRLMWELTNFPLAGRDDLADAMADQLDIVILGSLPKDKRLVELPDRKPDFVHPSIIADRQHSLRSVRSKRNILSNVR